MTEREHADQRLLQRLRLAGLAIPAEARVKLLRPPREQRHQWRWQLEVPINADRWEPTRPAVGSMAKLSECANAPRLRVILDEGTATVYPEPTLEPIPAGGRYRLSGTEPRFVSWKGEWCLMGPDWTLPIDRVITVRRFSDGEESPALVGEHVAERIVQRRATGVLNPTYGPSRVRYVIARIGDNNWKES